jgi:hypothetical protein
MNLLKPEEELALGAQLGQSLCKIACSLGLSTKSAEVTPEQAARSKDRLERMTATKPTAGQLGRYAGIGGGTGAAIGALGNVVEHYHRPATPGIKGQLLAIGQAAVRADKNPTALSKARSVAAHAVKGAVGGGSIPLIRNAVDRHAEKKVLKDYAAQGNGGKHA